ncbi:MAG: hypothetical protein OXE40_11695 [Gammaproteobacteria bacterium]|nr:hypothetical protein [Gammaproteobacteria bacterium]
MTALKLWIAANPYLFGGLVCVVHGCMTLSLHLAFWQRLRFPAATVSTVAFVALGLALWIEDVNWSGLVILIGAAIIYWLCWQWMQYERPGAPWAGLDEPPWDEE